MNKRTLYFMLTALVAIGCVALYTWFSEKSSSSPISKSTAEASSVQETIETAISNLDSIQVTPQDYNNLLIEITGYYNQGDITKDLKDTYLETLKDNYSQKSAFIVAQILQKEPIDKNEVKKYISHWATIKTNDPSVNEVKKDWQWYVFYTSILPKQIDNFIHTPIAQFSKEEYDKLMSKLKINPKFEHFESIKSIKEEMEEKLRYHYDSWNDYNYL